MTFQDDFLGNRDRANAERRVNGNGRRLPEAAFSVSWGCLVLETISALPEIVAGYVWGVLSSVQGHYVCFVFVSQLLEYSSTAH